MAGAALGMVVGGPIGSAVGAVIGAIAGGLGGSVVGESIEPTIEAPIPPSAPGRFAAAAGEATEEPIHWHEVIPSGLPSYEEIELRAYFLYEEEGRPEGQSVRHWLTAEESLRAEAAVI